MNRASSGWTGTRKSDSDKFGRLYRHDGDKLHSSSSVDPDILLSRSGGSGYRGGRPFFGADDRMRVRAGHVEYEGPAIGGIVLGLAALVVLHRALTSGRI